MNSPIAAKQDFNIDSHISTLPLGNYLTWSRETLEHLTFAHCLNKLFKCHSFKSTTFAHILIISTAVCAVNLRTHLSAASKSWNVTNANPFLLFVSLSVKVSSRSTFPNCPKNCLMSSSVISSLSPPMNTLFTFCSLSVRDCDVEACY